MPRIALMAKYNEDEVNEDPTYEYQFALLNDENKRVYREIDPDFETLQKEGYKEIFSSTKKTDGYVLPNSARGEQYKGEAKNKSKRELIIKRLCLEAATKLLTHAETLIKKYTDTQKLDETPVQALLEEIQNIQEKLKSDSKPPHPLETAKSIAKLVIQHKSDVLDDGFFSSFFREMAAFCKDIGMKPAAEFFTEKYAAGITLEHLENRVKSRPKM